MIELFAWIGLIISFVFMIYHRYMAANHAQVYAYIRKKYEKEDKLDDFPSKEDHEKDAQKFSWYTVFCSIVLIVFNLMR